MPTLIGTSITDAGARYLLQEIWHLLGEFDAYMDFKTELEAGDLGVEDPTDVNRVWAAIGSWLDHMDDLVTA